MPPRASEPPRRKRNRAHARAYAPFLPRQADVMALPLANFHEKMQKEGYEHGGMMGSKPGPDASAHGDEL